MLLGMPNSLQHDGVSLTCNLFFKIVGVKKNGGD